MSTHQQEIAEILSQNEAYQSQKQQFNASQLASQGQFKQPATIIN